MLRKRKNFVTLRSGPGLPWLRFYRYEEINNHISNSLVLYTRRCRTRRGPARAGYYGPTQPVVRDFNDDAGQDGEFARTLGI